MRLVKKIHHPNKYGPEKNKAQKCAQNIDNYYGGAVQFFHKAGRYLNSDAPRAAGILLLPDTF